jgi:CheY-like chemotaxis protein
MQPPTGNARSGSRAARILIVDDHEISRAALRALPRTEGIDVAGVQTGDPAITAAIAFRPDVVIVDVTPPTPPGSSSPVGCRRCRTLLLSCSPPAPAGAGSAPGSTITRSSPRQTCAPARSTTRQLHPAMTGAR